MPSDAPPFACVVLGAAGTPALDDAVRRAIELGAAPVVVPLPMGAAHPDGARVVTTQGDAPMIGALRRAMASLANTPAQGLLIWDTATDSPRGTAAAVLECVARTRASVVVARRGSWTLTPTWYARDTWLELMTVAERGLEAVNLRHDGAIQVVEVPDGVA